MTMPLLRENIILPAEYNALSPITEASRVLDDHSHDLKVLRSLLVKHKVPNYVCIRLIHKHFDVNAGEVMLLKDLEIAERGRLSVLRPTQAATAPALHGIHFLVDDDGQLQPYEYSTLLSPDTSVLEPFFAEFCDVVLKRGLQQKLGLKIDRPSKTDKVGWTEYEFAEDRSTMMIPEGWPAPEGEYEVNVQTEFHVNTGDDDEGCSHTTTNCKHQCTHPTRNPNDLFVDGRKIDPNSPFLEVYRAVVQAW